MQVVTGFNTTLVDESIALRYVTGFVTEHEAEELTTFCDTSGRWSASLTRNRATNTDGIEAAAGRTSESCPLMFSQCVRFHHRLTTPNQALCAPARISPVLIFSSWTLPRAGSIFRTERCWNGGRWPWRANSI